MSYIYGEGESDAYGLYDTYGEESYRTPPATCQFCGFPLDANGDCGTDIHHNYLTEDPPGWWVGDSDYWGPMN